jgi:hypothetical protein
MRAMADLLFVTYSIFYKHVRQFLIPVKTGFALSMTLGKAIVSDWHFSFENVLEKLANLSFGL